MHARASTACTRAFTLLEVLIVVIVLTIIAAIAIPQAAGAANDSRTRATRHALARARVAIADYRAAAALDGIDPYPTREQLLAEGEVLSPLLPDNPFTGVAGIRAVPITEAETRAVGATAASGWAYGVDNTAGNARAVIYANTDAITADTDPATGLPLRANHL